MIDELLRKYNLKYDDLNAAERETFNNWLGALEKGDLTTEKIRDYIHAMRDGVEQELTKMDNGNKQDIYLKARLKNYMLLEAFLLSPKKAKEAIEKALGNLKK